MDCLMDARWACIARAADATGSVVHVWCHTCCKTGKHVSACTTEEGHAISIYGLPGYLRGHARGKAHRASAKLLGE